MVGDYFYSTPAFEALSEWVHKHPRVAKEMSAYQSYLPGWYDKALNNETAIEHQCDTESILTT